VTPLEDHFRRPRNAGPMERADVHVQVENPVCGDVMHLYLRLGASGRVGSATFQVYGCPAAIAAGSLLTELVAGHGVEDLAAIDEKRVDEALGGLGGEKAHAAVLAADAVRAALAAASGSLRTRAGQ